ncbi:hypothetical protein U1872_20025 [Sphingomonas sp. RB3P16]|uniref:hypothetical protein n=1 Tax=Parasphingomonas frigoris TaxID=3096163 RepID=UPI002FCBDE5F
MPKSLSKRLCNARLKAGLTQQERGKWANLKQATILKLENGRGGALDTVFSVLTHLKPEVLLTERSTFSGPFDDIT